MNRIRGGDEPSQRIAIPASVGILHPKQRLDSPLHRRIAVVVSTRGKRRQRKRGWSRIRILRIRAAAWTKSPSAVCFLKPAKLLLVLGNTILNLFPKRLGFV